ncbi:metallophosphoesterase [Paraconexibacter algicola]|uniref:Calcineurin-like phosphoesterase domain-containing protein n=1 Tax=Paraconexibacter algicola TaxID=2133960 RepID=A0A2T4UF48_9ACTN|nr:metallophosphoesterase [Paraconexibacter algicola]PTL56404.1 hypothetical protein C7Y72_15690 [Paraconexibacter algicola]
MRTTVISDLHLGAHRAVDVLRRPGPLAGLRAALAGTDRLVLLGDVVELRQGPLRDALAAALPVLAALGETLGPNGEIVLVTGNHDHHLIAPWLEARAVPDPPPPLGLERRLTVRELERVPALRAIRDAVRPARLVVAFPGVALRDDVYALHGHYLDRVTTLPSFERLALGAMARVVGEVPEGRGAATAEDFEAGLQPLYAWMHALAQSPAGTWSAGTQKTSASTWKVLAGDLGDRRRSPRELLLTRAFPLAVGALNRARIGPLSADISAPELRRAGLGAIGEVVWRLGITAEHVIFGHTHRAGPLPGDHRHEWLVPGTGARLWNGGSWVDEPVFSGGDPDGPYFAGRAVVLDDDAPPRLERLVAALD